MPLETTLGARGASEKECMSESEELGPRLVSHRAGNHAGGLLFLLPGFSALGPL